MNRKMKVKIIINTILVIAISLALIIPSSAVIINNKTNLINNKNIIKEKLTQKPTTSIFKNLIEDDILISPYLGDDHFPSITEDNNGNTIVTWTNQQSQTETNWGIAYSETPTKQETWLNDNNTFVLTLVSISNGMYWDTAFIRGGDGDFVGLAGSFISKSEGIHGFYIIKDITKDPIENMGEDWLFWAIDNYPDVYNCTISDGPSFINKNNPTNQPGPFIFYIFTYDNERILNQTPVFTHILLNNLEDGTIAIAWYFDAQDFEQTLPADNPDYCALSNRYHTVVQNVDESKIIWKKIIPSEEPDYEFTPYQKTVAEGGHPCIAADENYVVILYVQDGNVRSAYSSNDGETFNIGSLTAGNYPEICVIDGVFYAAFIENNNLFMSISEDGGVSWGKPEQINDLEGTVVDEAGSIDIHESGVIVWVDNRSGELDIFLDEFTDIPKPKINIEQISDGIGISAVITNNGEINATNVTWNISLEGTLFFGSETSNIIPNIAIGESVEIHSGIPFGFGAIDIILNAECAEGVSDRETSSGKIFLFFITGLE